MLPYFLLFLSPLVGVFAARRLNTGALTLFLWLVGIFIILLIGLRHEVGGDWGAYLVFFERSSLLTFNEVISSHDPGYVFINWLVYNIGGSVHGVNTICGGVLVFGVIKFSLSQRDPWLSLLVAIPYLVIVVGMGYTRQSAALGLVLLAILELKKPRVWCFFFWMFWAATIHKSAVIIIPIAALVVNNNRFFYIVFSGVLAAAVGYFFLLDSLKSLWMGYVGSSSLSSEGAPVRVFMNLLPALIYLAFSHKLTLSESEKKLWWWVSISIIFCVPLVFMFSTAVDRVSLYFIPIQMFVFSNFYTLFRSVPERSVMLLLVIFYYCCILAIWLFFSPYASQYWIPYHTVFSS